MAQPPARLRATAMHALMVEEMETLGEKQQEFQKRDAYVGIELVPETRRLALMNCMLHDIAGAGEGAVHLGDTLTSDGAKLPKANLILSNPPFGTKKGAGGGSRDDLTFPTSNKQLQEEIIAGTIDGTLAADQDRRGRRDCSAPLDC